MSTHKSTSEAPEVATVVAWERDVGRHDFINQYSVQHVARQGAEHALCGSKIRWMYISAGDSRRCHRCFAAAEKRGYVDEWGELIARTEDDE